jgi:hypothetical protein
MEDKHWTDKAIKFAIIALIAFILLTLLALTDHAGACTANSDGSLRNVSSGYKLR